MGPEILILLVDGTALPDRRGLTTYNIGAEFAYELDCRGRNRNDACAAGAERLAAEADYLTAAGRNRAYLVPI